MFYFTLYSVKKKLISSLIIKNFNSPETSMSKSKKKIKLPPFNNNFYGIDTHCHLDMEAYESDFRQVIRHAEDNSIKYIVTIGIDLESSRKAVQIAAKNESIFAAIGIHPHNAGKVNDDTYDQLRRLADQPKIVAYGEIGLDYAKRYTSPEIQREHFRRQMQLAGELQLPVIIHDRDAHDDTLKVLREYSPVPKGGIMHCFSGDIEFARQIIDLGLHISIPGIVTFKNAHDLQHVARNIPLESMLLETDGPFLAPIPVRGKRNEPVNILYTAEKIAELRGISTEEVLAATTANAEKIFRINRP
jgi:TatD DNase family protein